MARAPGNITEREAAYTRSKRVVLDYERQLNKLARHIGELVKGHPVKDQSDVSRLNVLLRKYSEIIGPWAKSVASRMIAEVNQRDKAMWRSANQQIAKLVKAEVANSPVGNTMRELLDEQVILITDMPVKAGRRIQEIVVKNSFGGVNARASQLEKQIADTGDVTLSRAKVIARTEVSRASTALTQARATQVGSTHYVWRTARDAGVRPSHKKMQGVVCEWSKPPALSDGMVGHAGTLPNCRCWPDPIIPE